MNRLRALAACCLLALCDAGQAAPVLDSQPLARPRVALVLSGGGARGFAHIGVLRVLKEMNIPVDIVVGTSMGSVVGGAYAAGASVGQLEAMVRHTDWDSVIADRPARDDLAFRRRQEDLVLPSRIEFGLSGRGVSLPPAAAGNAALEEALGRVLPEGSHDTPVSQLPVPFRSVASDLVSGELVELDDTPLFLALRASLAVPGVFAPVRVRQRLVVDGGLVRNLPVDMAHAMGADIVIAVNVGTPLAPEEQLGSAVSVANQMLQILTEQNVQRSLKELRPQDILVAPDLTGVSFLDFHQHRRAMEAGAAATRLLAERLAPLALTDGEYAAHESRRLAPPALYDRALPLARLEVRGAGEVNPEALSIQSGLVKGEPTTLQKIRRAAAALYGRGDLARVETEVEDVDGQRSVVIKSTEAAWARSRLRIGLELASDFDDGNSFGLKAMHVRSSINRWGAELRTVAGIGTQRMLGIEFWQPLGAGSPWYLEPALAYGSASSDVFSEGRRALRVAYDVSTASLIAGRQLGNWGDLHVGVKRVHAGVAPSIPDDGSGERAQSYATIEFLSFQADTLDSLAFPSRGVFVDASIERAQSYDGAESTLVRSMVLGMRAFHTANWAGHVYGEWARAERGTAPLSLGGFLRLSGTTANSVEGRNVAFARVVMARRIAAMPSALGGVVRVGFSAELGSGFSREQPLRGRTLKQAGSAFIAVDTRFGPLYFGAGATRGDAGTLYLFLGPIW